MLSGEIPEVNGGMLNRPALLRFFRESDVRNCNPDGIRAIPGAMEYVGHSEQEYLRNADNCRYSYLIALARYASHLDAITHELVRIAGPQGSFTGTRCYDRLC